MGARAPPLVEWWPGVYCDCGCGPEDWDGPRPVVVADSCDSAGNSPAMATRKACTEDNAKVFSHRDQTRGEQPDQEASSGLTPARDRVASWHANSR